MSNTTVILVEEINLAELAKANARSQVRITMDLDTLNFIHAQFEEKYENTTDFDELIQLANHSKDMGFTTLSARIIDNLETNYEVQYDRHKKDCVSDHSAASDQDNR